MGLRDEVHGRYILSGVLMVNGKIRDVEWSARTQCLVCMRLGCLRSLEYQS